MVRSSISQPDLGSGKEVKMNIGDIAFWILVVTVSLWLIWDLVPDPVKKYWNYGMMLRQDRKSGKKRTYIFSFRNGVGREK